VPISASEVPSSAEAFQPGPVPSHASSWTDADGDGAVDSAADSAADSAGLADGALVDAAPDGALADAAPDGAPDAAADVFALDDASDPPPHATRRGISRAAANSLDITTCDVLGGVIVASSVEEEPQHRRGSIRHSD
jgi:hypothetical protein